MESDHCERQSPLVFFVLRSRRVIMTSRLCRAFEELSHDVVTIAWHASVRPRSCRLISCPPLHTLPLVQSANNPHQESSSSMLLPWSRPLHRDKQYASTSQSSVVIVADDVTLVLSNQCRVPSPPISALPRQQLLSHMSFMTSPLIDFVTFVFGICFDR